MNKSSDFGRVRDLLSRRLIVIVAVCAVGLIAMPFVATSVPAYKGTAQILIVSEALKDTTAADPDLPSIITSTEVLGRVISKLDLETDPVTLAKKIKTNLPAKSSIIEVTYKDTNAARAAAVTNGVADEASAYFHQIATRGYSDVIAALTHQIALSRGAIADADKRLERTSADYGFTSSANALDDFTSKINDLISQRGQLATTLAADRATAAASRKQLADIGAIARGEVLQHDTVYQQVATVVGKDTADLISQRAAFKKTFPGTSALAEKLSDETSQADSAARAAVSTGAGESPSYTQSVLDNEHADAAVAADLVRMSATDAQLAQERQRLRDAAGAGATVGTLSAERDTALSQYATLAQRLSTAQGDAAQAASLGRLVVVSRAIPGHSTLYLYLIAFSLFVIAFAFGAAYAVEAFDRRFWGTREVERVYRRPVLHNVGGNPA